jgi:MFS transporter, CP family, cyanate transporter
LPLLAFAAVSPLAPGLSARWGLERALGLALGTLAVGLAVRSIPYTGTLFAGTALLGVGIGLINVLLSALVKRDYPGRAAALTGLYTTVMGALAMTGSGIAVPVADHAPGGWRTSLGLWVIVAVIALAAWLPRLREHRAEPRANQQNSLALRRNPLAWQLTAFMGLQSLGFYVSVSWLPTILHAQGVSPAAAVLGVLSFLGFVVVPDLSWGWSATVGLSQGVGITLALSFFALRARDAREAAALSGMGQSLGYLLAAIGPLVFGVLHDATGGWGTPLVILAGLIGVQAVVSLGAGKARQLSG